MWGALVGAMVGMSITNPDAMKVIAKASAHALFQVGQIALGALLVGGALWLVAWLTIILLGKDDG